MDVNTNSDKLDQAIRGLLNYINDNELKDGNQLPPEQQLIEILGVSRSVLREALSYLKGIGLIQSRRGSSFKIQDIDPMTLFEQNLQLTPLLTVNFEEIRSLRATLELGAIEAAVENANEADRAELNGIVTEMQDLLKRKDATMEDYVKLDFEFHRVINRPANCRMLDILNKTFLDVYFKQSRVYQMQIHDNPIMDRVMRDHEAIAHAFNMGKATTAYQLLKDHFSYDNHVKNDEDN